MQGFLHQPRRALVRGVAATDSPPAPPVPLAAPLLTPDALSTLSASGEVSSESTSRSAPEATRSQASSETESATRASSAAPESVVETWALLLMSTPASMPIGMAMERLWRVLSLRLCCARAGSQGLARSRKGRMALSMVPSHTSRRR